jgi:ParB-like chromosome segregation protein Spo0J
MRSLIETVISEMTKPTKISVSHCKATQSKSETNPNQVDRCREDIREKRKIEPIEVVHDSEKHVYHVMDGHHRLEAHKAEKVDKISASIVHTGDTASVKAYRKKRARQLEIDRFYNDY